MAKKKCERDRKHGQIVDEEIRCRERDRRNEGRSLERVRQIAPPRSDNACAKGAGCDELNRRCRGG